MASERRGRVQEADLTLPTLQILAASPYDYVTTSRLIDELEALLGPTGKDAEVIEGRNDTYFSQKVRNIVSHRDSPNNPIAKGWIDYRKDLRGMKITPLGRRVLDTQNT